MADELITGFDDCTTKVDVNRQAIERLHIKKYTQTLNKIHYCHPMR